LKYGDPIFGKPARKFKPRKARVYNRYGLKAIHATRGHGLAQPAPYVKKKWLKDWDPSKHKRLLLGIFVLVVILAGTGMYADPNNQLFHNYQTNPQYGKPDPISPIWFDSLAGTVAYPPGSASQAGWKCNYGSLFFTGSPSNIIDLATNTTTTSICISTQSIDLSSVTGKVLEFDQSYEAGVANQNTAGTMNSFGFFLTNNDTGILPYGKQDFGACSSNVWKPTCDSNIYFSVTFSYVITGTKTLNIFVSEKTSSQSTGTIYQTDVGCGQATVILCTSMSGSGGIFNQNPHTFIQLNYTGSSYQTSLNRVELDDAVGDTPGLATSFVFPQLNLNQHYHWGFFMSPLPASGSAPQVQVVEFFGSLQPPANGAGLVNPSWNSLTVSTFTPNPPNTQPPPYTDAGGLFGPVINALINVGVYILQNIISFSTFLYSLYIIALNFIGGFLGLGNVGTNLDSFLRAFVQFMAQMASIIANLGSGITVLVNDISFGATFIVGLLTSTASWLSAAVLLGGKLKDIFDLVFRYGNNMLWIFFWSTFFLYTATGEGWSGTLEFFNAVNWASSLGANFVIRMVNFGVQAIAFIKGFIPTEAGAPPPTSPVSEGGKPSGASLQSTAKPVPAQPSRFKAGFSRSNIQRARGTTATKFKLSASRPAAPSFSAALEWDPIKVILLLGGLLLLMLWIGGGLSPFGTASATCTSTTAPTAGNTARCFQTSYDILSQITAPILLMFASIGSITFLADKFGMIGSTFSGPATFRAVPRRHVRQRRELMKLRAREKQLRMEFRK